MTPITLRSRLLTALSMALLATTLVLLVDGHFFSWNDVDGTQAERWNAGLGDLAVLTAVAAVVLALLDATARRWTGAVVASFVGLLVILEVASPRFAFVGSTDAFGLLLIEVGLGIVAVMWLTPRFVRPRAAGERTPWPRRLTAWARIDAYLVLLVVVAPVTLLYVSASVLTAGHPECNQPGDACTETYQALFLAFAAWCALVVLVVLTEAGVGVRRHLRRRRA